MGLTYIASVTASASATVSFTSGIDATYNEYQFHMVNMHPATDSANFQFQVNASDDTGGGFDESLITSTAFEAFHGESSTDDTLLQYRTPWDLAQEALYQSLVGSGCSNDDDHGMSGVLTLYDPASTTYAKHFTARTMNPTGSNYATDSYIAGYINQPLAIPEISFKFHSGNINAGTIHMYGVG
jgi:hypothetical protein